jgi:hypothetical protein
VQHVWHHFKREWAGTPIDRSTSQVRLTAYKHFNSSLISLNIITYLTYYTVLAALMWYSIGVTYGIMYEKFPLPLAFRFALGAMAASGVPPPVCMHVDGYYDCQLGSTFNMTYYVFCYVGLYCVVSYKTMSYYRT